VVGLGKMGIVHAATVKTHPQVEIVAYCDTSKFMLQSLKTFLTRGSSRGRGEEPRFYSDYRRMLRDEQLDLVYITTPTGAHSAIAVDCAQAGKHFFVEKPLGTDLEEAQKAASAVAAAGVKTQVGYVCRYAPTFEKAREILTSGALGRILGFGAVKYSSDVLRKVEKSWRFMRKSSEGGGGVVNEFTCHAVDLLVWFFGEPADVSARTENWYSAEVEDYVHAVMVYDGFSGWLDSSWSMQDYRKPYTRIEVTGDNGKLVVTDSEVKWLVKKKHASFEPGWYSLNATDLYQPVRIFVGDIMFTRQADDFLRSILSGGEPRSPAPEALRTQRVLEMIKKGAKR